MITITKSQQTGYFTLNGVDIPIGSCSIDYKGSGASMLFSLYDINSGEWYISGQKYTYVDGVNSWAELVALLYEVGAIVPKGSGSQLVSPIPYNLAVSMGKIKGSKVMDKFGFLPSISPTEEPMDVWEQGGIYTFPANGTAPIANISSSDDTDAQTIRVYGLDIDGYEVEQEITLQGNTVLTLPTPLWRVYRMVNIDSFDIQGVVYCYEASTVTAGVPLASDIRAIIDGSNNQTLMAIYTIPKGKTGYLTRGEVGLEFEQQSASSSNELATVQYYSRRYGSVFVVGKKFSLASAGVSIHQDIRSYDDIVPELTDILVRVVKVSDTVGVWATFDILLEDND